MALKILSSSQHIPFLKTLKDITPFRVSVGTILSMLLVVEVGLIK